MAMSDETAVSGPVQADGAEEESSELKAVLDEIARRFQVSFHPLQYDDVTFQVLDVANMTQYLDRLLATKAIKNPLKDLPLWAKIWPGSFVLETYLRKKAVTQGRNLLELGCGCGVLSLLASRLGFASITASDVEDEALLFARANVLKNHLEHLIHVQHVDVTRPGKNPCLDSEIDIIAASEILYLDDLHTPLLNFLDRHLAQDGQAVFCTDMARRKPHFARKAAKRFKVQELYLPGSFTDKEGALQRRLYSLLIVQK